MAPTWPWVRRWSPASRTRCWPPATRTAAAARSMLPGHAARGILPVLRRCRPGRAGQGPDVARPRLLLGAAACVACSSTQCYLAIWRRPAHRGRDPHHAALPAGEEPGLDSHADYEQHVFSPRFTRLIPLIGIELEDPELDYRYQVPEDWPYEEV